jgi:hypothetical protein
MFTFLYLLEKCFDSESVTNSQFKILVDLALSCSTAFLGLGPILKNTYVAHRKSEKEALVELIRKIRSDPEARIPEDLREDVCAIERDYLFTETRSTHIDTLLTSCPKLH